jgi:hypothetical protein
VVRGQHRVVGHLGGHGRRRVAELGLKREHATEVGEHAVECIIGQVVVDVGPVVHVGDRVRVVWQPLADGDAPRPHRHERRPPVRQGRHLHDARHRADVAPDVAAAHLAAAFDQNHAELGLTREAVGDQRSVARLEDVERQHGAGQQHGAEREHRQPAHPPPVATGAGENGARSGWYG